MKRYDTYTESAISWIGKVPSHWEVLPFGRHFTYGKGLPITKSDLASEGIPVISYGQIHAKYNTGTSISDEMVRKVSSAYLKSNPQSLLQTNDFVFADTSEDIDGAGNFAFNDRKDFIFAGYHTLIARPSGLKVPKYYAYLFGSTVWRRTIQSLVNGVKVYSISKRVLKQSSLLVPPQEEQEAIVAYLDEKCAQIDRYVASLEERIERLSELRQALIAEAVTRGINPQAPLRPSGIPWLGEIPKHWEVKRLGSCFTENTESNADQLFNEAYKFNYGTLVRKLEDTSSQEVIDTYSKYTVLKEGDIVINGLNLNYDFVSQRVAQASQPGLITSAYLVLTPRRHVNQAYYCFLFKAMDSQKLFHGMGTGIRLTLSYKYLKPQNLPVPPQAEQEAIVAYLDEKTTQIDRYTGQLEEMIRQMRDLRQTIISEAVTGKICVLPN